MTIQDALRKCDKKEVADIYIYKYKLTPFNLCVNENDDVTIGEIKLYTQKRISETIDLLCNMTPKPLEEREVLLAVHTADQDDDVDFNLYKAEDLMEDKEFYTSYGYELTPFNETLDFEVADTYLTQYYLNELIAKYLYEVTWTGWKQENLEKELKRLEEAAKESEEHPENLVEWDSDKMREEFGLEKEDPKQLKAWRKLIRQQGEYYRKCVQIEVKKWRNL